MAPSITRQTNLCLCFLIQQGAYGTLNNTADEVCLFNFEFGVLIQF